MKDRWEDMWEKLGAHGVPQDVFDELVQAYSSPDRFYHSLTHVEDCLALVNKTRSLAAHPEEVELATWFHDAVYDTRRDDNEQKSAAWAEVVIGDADLSNAIAERVSRSILATRHDTQVTDTDPQLLVDVDLSILGRETDVFWQYEEDIRKEYTWVPAERFRQARMKILQGFLDRRHIYYHQEYREMFEATARLNLSQAIERLSGS